MTNEAESDEASISTLPVLAQTDGEYEPRVRFRVANPDVGTIQVYLTMIQVDQIIKNFMAAQHQARQMRIDKEEIEE